MSGLTRPCESCDGSGEIAISWTSGSRDEAPEPVSFGTCPDCNDGQVPVLCDSCPPVLEIPAVVEIDGVPLCAECAEPTPARRDLRCKPILKSASMRRALVSTGTR